MPKVAPYTDNLDTSIRATIGAVVFALDINQAELAERIGMTSTTMTARMKCPGNFKADELRRIAEVSKKGGYDATFTI